MYSYISNKMLGHMSCVSFVVTRGFTICWKLWFYEYINRPIHMCNVNIQDFYSYMYSWVTAIFGHFLHFWHLIMKFVN